MLINCPECGKEISDKAPACIHCGFPLDKINESTGDDLNRICKIRGVDHDLTAIYNRMKELKDENLDDGTLWGVIVCLLSRQIGISIDEMGDLAITMVKTNKIPSTYIPVKSDDDEDEVRCPRCDSNKITTGPRGANGFWGFIGASKTVNRCAKCGYTWTPRG